MIDEDEETDNLPIGRLMTQLTTQEGASRPGGSAVAPGGDPVRPRAVDVDNHPSVAEPAADTFPDATVKTPRVPAEQRIGRYVVLDRLGIGGMAELFVARDPSQAFAAKNVVIKRSLPHLRQNARFVEMFLREAHIATRLKHPNIIDVFELGEDGSDHFIAMEHVEGLTLHSLARRAWHREESIPMEAVLRVVADAAAGLAYAHGMRSDEGEVMGLVHRDISPDNLMVNLEGVTKVLDFGIAKASDMQSLTQTGEVKGKIPFMSPEQVRGEPLDHRTDLYALGVCLYWLLTGRRPSVGVSDFLTMRAVLEETPAPPSQLNPEVPAVLDAVVLRLLEKDPAKRFQSGDRFVDALVEVLPMGRRQTVDFVRAALGWPEPAAEDVTLSVGLTASTPVTARLKRPRYGPDIDTERFDAGVSGAEPTEPLRPAPVEDDVPLAEPDTIVHVREEDTETELVRQRPPPTRGVWAAAGALALAAAILAAWILIRG